MLELRNITPDEFERWMRTESRAHSNRSHHDPEALRPHFDSALTIAVFEDGQIVGGAHSHLLGMSVPGGGATVASVSNVEVQPMHTQRGIMTQMMSHQIDGIHERSEPLASCSTPRAPSTGGSATASGRCKSSGASKKRTTLKPTIHSATSHRKVRNTVPLGPPPPSLSAWWAEPCLC